jgi:rubrerythrin
MKTIEVTVWVCPRCGNYYGATSAGNLHKFWNRDMKGFPTHRRSQCPNCKIPRKPHTANIEIPNE